MLVKSLKIQITGPGSRARQSYQEFSPLSRRIYPGRSLACLGVALGLAVGCDYSRERNDVKFSGTYREGAVKASGSAKSQRKVTVARDSAERAAILASSIELIQRAALQPGGDNFGLATQKLNQFFEGTPESEYLLDFAARVPATAVAAGEAQGDRDNGLEPARCTAS